MADHSPETGKAPSAIPEPEKTSDSPESNFVDANSEDNTQVTTILNQLEDLLADNNTTAGELFEKSRSILTSSLGDAAGQIDRQIQDFDFTEALLTLRTARNANGFARNKAA